MDAKKRLQPQINADRGNGRAPTFDPPTDADWKDPQITQIAQISALGKITPPADASHPANDKLR
jgi:hypothetical protein